MLFRSLRVLYHVESALFNVAWFVGGLVIGAFLWARFSAYSEREVERRVHRRLAELRTPIAPIASSAADHCQHETMTIDRVVAGDRGRVAVMSCKCGYTVEKPI